MRPPVTVLGSWPGTDFAAAQRLLLGELPDLSHLVELPERGPGSQLIGRTAAQLAGLSVDLQASGWRLTDHPGVDARRAAADWRRDLDQLEEQAQGYPGTLVVSLAGPWTLAAGIDTPRGDKLLGDHGARRELGESLAEGAAELLGEISRRLPGVPLWLQVDEPLLPRVLAGQVKSASGFGRLRSVQPPEVSESLRRLENSVRQRLADHAGGGYRSVLHCCAPGVDAALVFGAGFDDLAVDARHLDTRLRDRLGPLLEAGHWLWLGAAASQLPDQVPRPDALAATALAVLRGFELGPELVSGLVLTPACGLAGWRADPAVGLVRALHEAAGLVAEELLR